MLFLNNIIGKENIVFTCYVDIILKMWYNVYIISKERGNIMYINIDISEKNLIYILNSLNFFMRCMERHYEITDIKGEVKKYINYDNYYEDYDNIRFLHRVLSTRGNSEIYNISNNVFFKGQADFLATKEKDFEILNEKSRYNIVEEKIPVKRIDTKNNFFVNLLLTKIKK